MLIIQSNMLNNYQNVLIIKYISITGKRLQNRTAINIFILNNETVNETV